MSYKVQKGDTLSGIAARFQVSLSALEKANPQVRNPNQIYAGEPLNIPGQTDTFQPAKPSTPSSQPSGKTSTYTVRSGDTLSGIAGRFGISLSALEGANPQVQNPNSISVGESLNIPAGAKSGSTGTSTGVSSGKVTQTVPGQVGSWIAQAQSALEQAGVPLSKMSASAINIIIQHESGGNPSAENKWDINWKEGHPSIGLMQVIGPTFNSYHLAGHNDIWNPVDNIIAGVRYAIARYGSLDQVPGVVRVRQGLSYVGY